MYVSNSFFLTLPQYFVADPKKDPPYIKQYIKAIRALLTHTNATPFKIRAIHKGYSCFFCPLNDTFFKDPADLRAHTHSAHQDRVFQTEFAIRPYHLNQMIRFDVVDFVCDCEENVVWSDLLEHLGARHGVSDIKEPWNKIVPYELQLSAGEMSCLLCSYTSCFNRVDTHMNIHFPNFTCGECGKPYLTNYRLSSHKQFHRTGAFPCAECNLVFASKKVRRYHVDKIHDKKLLFKCALCPERFASDQMKLQHLRENHKDKLRTLGRTCKVCNRSFWTKEYWSHVAKGHKEFLCAKCGKRFESQKLLDDHKCKEGTVKRLQCHLCFKCFFTVEAVATHKEQGLCRSSKSLKNKKI